VILHNDAVCESFKLDLLSLQEAPTLIKKQEACPLNSVPAFGSQWRLWRGIIDSSWNYHVQISLRQQMLKFNRNSRSPAIHRIRVAQGALSPLDSTHAECPSCIGACHGVNPSVLKFYLYNSDVTLRSEQSELTPLGRGCRRRTRRRTPNGRLRVRLATGPLYAADSDATGPSLCRAECNLNYYSEHSPQ